MIISAIERIYAIINLDLPLPIMPVINPWGPGNFSCKSKTNDVLVLYLPTRDVNEFVGLFVYHLFNIFNCSILPTLYIFKYSIDWGSEFSEFNPNIGIFEIIDITSSIFLDHLDIQIYRYLIFST